VEEEYKGPVLPSIEEAPGFPAKLVLCWYRTNFAGKKDAMKTGPFGSLLKNT